ncbi:DUF6583 family protein [Pontibacillus litoralis]|uniref:Uncharacterized protein n=1 Tax=Pontibacillus litoralis JSM 072002 TaxID=1385512 RepID=A0A0A5G5R6_9BACI|nr:DUF6583 family protein [Pontibacillus litoralis]KGX87399.1 hypothetical protein N784_15720 [Pontibacillus litoralis JSM 072002]
MTEQKKGVNKWLVIVISAIVVIALGATAFGVMKSNSPMAMYANAEKDTLTTKWDRLKEYNKNSFVLQERLMEEAYKADADMSVNVSAEGTQVIPELQMIQGILSTLQLKMDTQVNPETNEMFGGLDIQLQGTSLASGSIYQNEESTGVKVPFLYDKYFALKNNELGDFMERMGEPSQGVTEIPNFVESNKAAFTPEQINEIVEDYNEALMKHISEDQFTLEEGVTYNEKKYDKVTIEISEETAQAMVTTLLEKLKEDERLWEEFDKQMKLQGLNPQSEQESIKESIDEALANVEKITLPNGIVGEAYIKDDVVEQETWTIEIANAEEKDTFTIVYANDYLKESEDAYTSNTTLEISNSKGKMTLNLDEKGKPNKDGFHVDYTIGVATEGEAGDFSGDVVLNADYTETSINMEFDVNMQEQEGMESIPVVDGYMNMETLNEEKDTFNNKMDIGVNVVPNDPAMANSKFNVEFNIDQNYTFTDDLTFPSLEGEEAVQVMEKSDEELAKIVQEIEKNFETYMQGMMGGLGAF